VVFNRFYTARDRFTPTDRGGCRFRQDHQLQERLAQVSLDYAFTPDIMVYGRPTRGFKSGGYNIRANAVAVPRSAEPFDDETVDSYELGTRWRSWISAVPEPVGLPQQVQGHPAVGVHQLRQQWRRH
jgi:iron complex outermembrane receptor protein